MFLLQRAQSETSDLRESEAFSLALNRQREPRAGSACLWADDVFAAHVHSQRLWNANRTVVVEVVFQECNHHTRRCNNGVVEGVRQIGLFCFLVLNADSQSACLSVTQICLLYTSDAADE